MKKMKKIFAVILSLAMVLGMSVNGFAAKVENQYTNNITITNLAADVDTTLKVYNIIYLDQDDAGNQTWKVVDWAKNYISENSETGAFTITNADGLKDAADKLQADDTVKESRTSHEFTNLPIGAYVIRAFDTKGTYDLMVANTYDKDGNVYMASKPADVTAKMGEYKVTKEADDKFVHRGQTVNFTVTTQMAPKKNSQNEALTTFKVIDTSTGLKEDSFKLTKVTIAGEEKAVGTNKVTAVKNLNGTVTFTVDLTEFIEATASGSTIVVEYSAVVENDHTYNNSATADGNTVTYTPGTVNGFEGSVTLKKVDTKETVLKGAEFQLLKVTSAATDSAEATKTPVSVVKVEDGVYKVALEGETGATTTLVATNGTLKVTGLDEGNYEFKETKAPEGYKVASENKSFTITADEEKEVTVNAGNFVNTKLSALPSTGGMGTTLFTIAGCAIMVAAAGFFFASRKRVNK